MSLEGTKGTEGDPLLTPGGDENKEFEAIVEKVGEGKKGKTKYG